MIVDEHYIDCRSVTVVHKACENDAIIIAPLALVAAVDRTFHSMLE